MTTARAHVTRQAAYIAHMPSRTNKTVGVALASALALTAACVDLPSRQKLTHALQLPSRQPDELPKVLNSELPFRYPAALYARRIQGNVTLRMRIERNGLVLDDSTRVEDSSGYPALDSAALRGSRELHFVPAKRRGESLPATVLFPIYFRHPEARPLPGDTILSKHRLAK